jgi:hypothetical protein
MKVLREDRQFSPMRWEPTALQVVIWDRTPSLGTPEGDDGIGDMGTRWHAGVSRLLALRFLAILVCSFVQNRHLSVGDLRWIWHQKGKENLLSLSWYLAR